MDFSVCSSKRPTSNAVATPATSPVNVPDQFPDASPPDRETDAHEEGQCGNRDVVQEPRARLAADIKSVLKPHDTEFEGDDGYREAGDCRLKYDPKVQ